MACDDGDPAPPTGPAEVTLTVRNISAPGDRIASDGTHWDVMLSPGVWAVHDESFAVVPPGTSVSGTPTEALAEDGNLSPLLTALQGEPRVIATGIVGEDDPDVSYSTDPIAPGREVTITFEIEDPGPLWIGFMFAQSNDVMLASNPEGIALDLADDAVHDVTERMGLWDAGTEVNEEPGIGPTQAPRQGASGGGEDEAGLVTLVDGSDAAGFAYPAVTEFVQVEITRTPIAD
jgi:hypothetical protein